MDPWQVLALLFSGVSTAGVLGIFYRLGVYAQKVDGHDKALDSHGKRLDRHDDRLTELDKKLSSVHAG